MALPIYSTRLFTVQAGDSSGSPYYSDYVPDGSLWVVRDVSAYTTSNGIDLGAYLYTQLPDESVFLWWAAIAEASSTVVSGAAQGRVVLNPGERLLLALSGGSTDFQASGYVLSTT